MKIGIVGNGVVGNATARSYVEHVDEVRIYDKIRAKATNFLSDVLECDLVFVCLPTPQSPNSLECDLSCLTKFFASVKDYGELTTNLVLRSTVPIGTTKRFRELFSLPNLVHSPEFLTARCAVVDAQIPARNIIGCTSLPKLEHGSCAYLLGELYRERFPSVHTHWLMSDESEAVKLFQNSFFAVKVAFFNEINQLAKKLGLDWNLILNAMLADGRIHPSHTKVPGPDGKYGFGGTCLPKDLANLVITMIDNGLASFNTNGRMVSSSAHFCNIEHRKREVK